MLFIFPQTNVEQESDSPCGVGQKEQAPLSQNLFPNHFSRDGVIEMQKRERVRVRYGPYTGASMS